MPYLPRRRLLLAIALAATGFGSAAVTAQLQSDAAQETIQIRAGDILEILPVHSLPSATYSWILTQDRNFIEVARSAFYNTRLTTTGRFSLNAEIGTPHSQAAIRRVFTIDVVPRQTPPDESASAGGPLVRTTPELRDDGFIILPPRRELLLLSPLRSDLFPMHIDLDARNDTDDDGTLTNDNDSAGTFFQTSGTPLYLWFTSAAEQRDITFNTAAPESAPLTQTLSILTAEFARQRGLFVSRVLIATEERGPKAILFSPQFDDGGAPALPLAFHWNFGDDSESIEAQPLHEFAAYGTYSVRLSVRNIETGQEIAARTKAVALQAPLISDPRADVPLPTLPQEPQASPPRASFLRIVFTIIGVAVGFAAIGFAVAWAYRAAQAYLLKRKTAAQPPEAPPSLAPPPSPPKTPQPPAPPAPAPTKLAQPPKAAPPIPSVPVPETKKPAPAPAAPEWMKKTSPPPPPPLPMPPPPPKPSLPPTVPTLPTPESDRTIAIVQAENFPPPPKPPVPHSNPTSQSPKETPHPGPLPL